MAQGDDYLKSHIICKILRLSPLSILYFPTPGELVVKLLSIFRFALLNVVGDPPDMYEISLNGTYFTMLDENLLGDLLPKDWLIFFKSGSDIRVNSLFRIMEGIVSVRVMCTSSHSPYS